MTKNTAKIFGAAAIVCSCTWVTAWIIPTIRPIAAAVSTQGIEIDNIVIKPFAKYSINISIFASPFSCNFVLALDR